MAVGIIMTNSNLKTYKTPTSESIVDLYWFGYDLKNFSLSRRQDNEKKKNSHFGGPHFCTSGSNNFVSSKTKYIFQCSSTEKATQREREAIGLLKGTLKRSGWFCKIVESQSWECSVWLG